MSEPLAATEGMAADKSGGVVGPKCDDSTAPGHWRCLTHHEDFPHNFAMHSHTSTGRHVVAWVCHIHGPEVP